MRSSNGLGVTLGRSIVSGRSEHFVVHRQHKCTASFVKGGSSNSAIDRTVQAFHFLCCHLHCQVWFEYVRSEANWSDGISRNGFTDEFAIDYGFELMWAPVCNAWWCDSLGEIWSDFKRTTVGRTSVAGSGS